MSALFQNATTWSGRRMSLDRHTSDAPSTFHFVTLLSVKTKVLVVDDEPDFVHLLAYNLTRAGFEVLEALNGLDAVHLARRHLPDIVLLDVMMPHFDGFSVCEVLARHDSTARIPVVILTALNGPETQERAMQAGAVEQLTKPVELSK